MLYYSAKDIFKPLIIFPYYNASTADLQVWVTSDLWNSVSGTVSYSWIDWSGRPLSVQSATSNYTFDGLRNGTGSASMPFHVGPINSTQILHYPNLNSTFSSSRVNKTGALLMLSATSTSSGQSYTHSSVFHPTTLREVAFQDPGLHLTNSGSQFTVTATEAVAAWVWLEYATNDVQGYWSENGFWLNKGESKTVSFTVWKDSTGERWVDTVSARSVYNNTLS